MTMVIPNSDDEEDSGQQNSWIHHKSNIINASLEHDERVYSDQEEIEEAEGLFVTEAKDQADNIFGYYEASKLPSRQNQLLLSRMPRRRTRECENHAPHRSLVSSAARRGTIDSLPDNPAADISVPTLQLSQPTKTSKLIPVTSFRERVHDLVKACSGEKQENEWEACRFSIPVVTNESYQVNHAVRNDQSELANDGHLKSQTLDERSKSTAEARTFHEQSWVNCRFESVAGAAAAGDPQTHQHNSISNNIHVMYSKLREPLPESKSRDLKAKRTLGNVNKGWGTNFVRTNLKVTFGT